MSGEQLPSPEASQSPVEPRIYVASLTDYNAGILHGAWVEASLPTEDMQASVDQMLADSPTARRYGEPAEEWAIHDYEGFGPHAHIAEYESLATVGALARGIAKYDEAFVAWWSHDPPGAEGSEGDLDRRFEESYQGEYSSLEAYGEQTLDEMGLSIDDIPEIPESLRPYVRIDAEAWVRDLVYGGDIFTISSRTGIYVFWNY